MPTQQKKKNEHAARAGGAQVVGGGGAARENVARARHYRNVHVQGWGGGRWLVGARGVAVVGPRP